MGRFHYAASQEPGLSFFRITFPATVFQYQSLQCAGERTSLLLGIYNMLKNSQTESFFQKFFIFFFLPGGLTPAKSGKHQHSASKRNRQRHLCMQDILCRLESNRSRFRSYVPAAVPNPLQALVLTCPGFSFFCTYFSLLIAASASF